MKVKIVFSMKAKTHMLTAFWKMKLFKVYENKTQTKILNINEDIAF